MNWTINQTKALQQYHKNLIVSAGAGSGKTAVLSQRVLEIISTGVDINKLLIVTFTDLAANQMRSRIRKRIVESILSTPNEHLKRQLDLIDGSYITTFDSFAFSIVKKYHYLLNVDKFIKVLEGNLFEITSKKIIEQIFLNYYEEENPQFLKVISEYYLKEDNSFQKEVFQLIKKIDLLIDKNTYLENYCQINSFEKGLNLYFNLINKNLQETKELYYEAKQFANEKEEKKIETIFSAFIDLKISNKEDYLDLKEKLQAVENEKLPSVSQKSDESFKLVKPLLNDKYKELKNLCKYETISMFESEYQEMLEKAKVIIDIIQKYDQEMNKFKKNNNVYTFSDIALMAINIFEQNPTLQAKEKNNYYEIMVDEYQDTSDIQEKFIDLISSENVYMVGDIKQSIYRFRNANPLLFKNKYELYSQGTVGVKIDLQENFRSRREVIVGINEIFNNLMTNELGMADYKNSHQMIYGNINYEKELSSSEYGIELYNYNTFELPAFSNNEIEAFVIAKDIQEKIKNKFQVFDDEKKQLRDAKYDDFLIMLPNDCFDLYKKIFEYCKIPLSIIKNGRLENKDTIYIIKNIIRLIIEFSNQDSISYKYGWTSIARSYLFSYDDGTIAQYLNDKQYQKDEITNKIFQVVKRIKELSYVQLINIIIDEFAFLKKLPDVGDVKDSLLELQYIVKMFKSFDELGYDIKEVYDIIDKSLTEKIKIEYPVIKDSSNCVSVMTIHKSKGLEYNICYLAGLTTRFNDADSKSKFIFEKEYGIISSINQEKLENTFLKTAYYSDAKKANISEKIRLLYVALTRCKEKMIIVTSYDDEKKLTHYNQLYSASRLSALLSYVDEATPSVKKRMLNVNNYYFTKDYNKVLESNYSDYILKSPSDPTFAVFPCEFKEHVAVKENHFSKTISSIITPKEYELLQYGTLLHEQLENIDFRNITSSDIKTAEIKNFINSPLLKNIDKSKNIYQEYEFIYVQEGVEYHGIIDLLIEYDDYIDVIDYKLKNIEDEAYVKQLNGYKNYLQLITSKEVNIYLYSLLTSKYKQL